MPTRQTSANDAAPTQPRRGFARAAKVSLPSKKESTVVDSRVDSDDAPTLPLTAQSKPPKALKLGRDTADKQEAIAASALCDRLYHLLESTDNKPFGSKTRWRSMQMRNARELAKAEIVGAAFDEKLEAFHEYRGYYPRMMQWLLEFLDRSAGVKGAPARVDSCGCPLPPGVKMPPLERGQTVHFARDQWGDVWTYGNEDDPPFIVTDEERERWTAILEQQQAQS